ncbi:hypothetical protein CVT26_000168 [Gymnopilus dilepis]|uniref:Uncharacterized protein n=1 Tax=Gymnopilus dilepis TaxID=231916 RepID=A0A409WW57_9AGAR|nr:hypothetical protein CVT26_000168 [Gymnopilus dilepis]
MAGGSPANALLEAFRKRQKDSYNEAVKIDNFIKALQLEISDLKRKNAILQDIEQKYASLERQVADLKQSSAALKDENASLKGQLPRQRELDVKREGFGNIVG